jgi:hypothetical protein
MSFASLNAVNASRGMQGSKQPQTFQGQSNQGPMAPYGSQQPTGMPSVHQQMPQGMPPPTGPNGSQAYGMQATLPSQYVNRAQQGANIAPQHAPGVVPGQQMPSAVPQQMPMKFDPNDPANAALAGYMAR